jgi:hypothetical protein
MSELPPRLMRRTLVDHVRQHLGAKHGGRKMVSLNDVAVLSDERAGGLVALDEALN